MKLATLVGAVGLVRIEKSYGKDANADRAATRDQNASKMDRLGFLRSPTIVLRTAGKSQR